MSERARIGIVDMGSNAIRFMIAEVEGDVHRVVKSHRLAVRLGRSVFQSGEVSDATISDIVDAFRRFRTSCHRHGVSSHRAIATSAMRDARNRATVVDRVREAADFEIEVVSGEEEARLLKLGVETGMDLSQGRSVLADVGGGSVEITVVDDGDVTSAGSYPLGAVRMLQQFGDVDGAACVALMKERMRGLEQRIADRLAGRPVDRFVAVGGNIEALVDLVAARRGPARHEGVDACQLGDLDREVAALAELTVEARIDDRALRADRADTIVPAGLVYAQLCRLAGAERVLAPRTGVKEGLLAEVVQRVRARSATPDDVDVVLSSCRALGERFHYEAEHAQTVLGHARQLFDQTRALHGLGDGERVLLEAAALLHDIGVAVNNDGHHKHSQYLIESSEIAGLDREERRLVAMVARYHRKAEPSREHASFAAMRRRDRERIERLAALLRVADALDRQHAGVVCELETKQCDGTLQLRPALAPGQRTRLALEAKALAEKGALFARLFGLAPVLTLP